LYKVRIVRFRTEANEGLASRYGNVEKLGNVGLWIESCWPRSLVIESTPTGHYRGIGTVIYASQRAGVSVENLRWTMDDGTAVSFEELKARNSTSSI
jgi:hypothetical protein